MKGSVLYVDPQPELGAQAMRAQFALKFPELIWANFLTLQGQ